MATTIMKKPVKQIIVVATDVALLRELLDSFSSFLNAKTININDTIIMV